MALFASAGFAAENLAPPGNTHAQVDLITQHSAVAPGQETLIGVRFRLDDGWHTYFDGLNDTGMPATVTWSLPAGWSVSELRWPTPKRYTATPGVLDHVYEREVTLLATLSAPVGARPGPATISAQVDFLVCSDVCLPGKASAETRLDIIGPAAQAERTSHAGALEAVQATLPKPLRDAGDRLRVAFNGGVLRVDAPGAAAVRFYPGKTCSAPVDLLAEGESKSTRLAIRLRALAGQETAPLRASGIIEVERTDGKREAFWVDLPPRPSDLPR